MGRPSVMHPHGPPAGPAIPGGPRAPLAPAASRPWWRAACAPCWAAAHDRHTAAHLPLPGRARHDAHAAGSRPALAQSPFTERHAIVDRESAAERDYTLMKRVVT